MSLHTERSSSIGRVTPNFSRSGSPGGRPAARFFCFAKPSAFSSQLKPERPFMNGCLQKICVTVNL